MMDPVTNTTQGNVDDDGGSDTIDSPPRPVRTSSPRHPISSSSSSPLPNMSPPTRNNQNSALNNFQKYGSIRPPLSVLQDEFCETYRLWEEHDAILRRVEVKFTDSSGVIMRNFGNKNDRSDWRKFKPRQVEVSDDGVDDHSDEDDLDEEAEWEEAFAHLRTLYSRHHHEYVQEQPFALGDGQSCRNKNEFLESLCAIDDDDNDTLEEKLEEVDDNKEDTKLGSCEETDIDNTAEQQQKQQQQRKKRDDIENLTKLFRPGSKFTGTVDVVSQLGSKRTSLVIMEENTCDELGRPKGYLARQKRGTDEQCVFVHVTFVPLSDAMSVMATFDDYDLTEEETITSARPPPQSQSPQDTEERMTIQIEYSDSEKRYWGFWNPNTLSFQGTVHKLDDANDTQGATDRGGLRNSPSTNNVIMSGLISGRAAGTASGSDVGDGSGAGDAENTTGVVTAAEEFTVTSALSSKRSKRKQPTFSLSPCTHLHPRGRVQTLWDPFAVSNLVNMMGSDYLVNDVGFLGLASSVKKRIKVSEKAQLSFMDELASDDNHKLALHRARTEQLLLQTLAKLTELGELIDFAELARKRNIAKRRKKWRGRMRKITPRLPRKLKKQKSKQVDGGEELGVSSFDSVQKNKVQFYDHLAAISWESLLDAASIQAQRTCAIFRHRSTLLDSLTFQSDEYKYQVMSDLRANGLTLASSHSEWDRCIQMGRTVSLGWSWFERGSWGCFERSAVVGRRCVYILFQMHSKLSVCHEQLEKSFRCADARISNARLESFKRVKRSGDKSGEVLCGICQCDIYEADGNEEEDSKEATDVVTLPCSHSFHWNCIREWLHDHSQCPLCRIDLNE